MTFAALAQYFEPGWGMDNSVYFAIISFTTVGLGDFYPKPTPETGLGSRLGGYFFFSILLLVGLALVSAVIAAVSDAAEIAKRLAKKRMIALEQKLERSLKRKITRRKTKERSNLVKKLDKKTKPDYNMSEKERNEIRCHILSAVRQNCGAGSDTYNNCVQLIESIQKYRAKKHVGTTHILSLEAEVKELCKQVPDAKHEFVVYLLNFIHNVHVETDAEEAQDVVWELRIKKSLGFGAFGHEEE